MKQIRLTLVVERCHIVVWSPRGTSVPRVGRWVTSVTSHAGLRLTKPFIQRVRDARTTVTHTLVRVRHPDTPAGGTARVTDRSTVGRGRSDVLLGRGHGGSAAERLIEWIQVTAVRRRYTTVGVGVIHTAATTQTVSSKQTLQRQKVCPWWGPPSDRGRLKNKTEKNNEGLNVVA